MNPIDIYKLLPKKNCGQCPQRTCMAFALCLPKGEADVDDCPYLDNPLKAELEKVKSKDWRETLIINLRNDIKLIDFREIDNRVNANYINGSLKIRCLGTEYIISPDGEITTEGYINPWIKILLLHYIRAGGRGNPSGKWVSFSELKSGMFKASSFNRDCEEPLRELLDTDFEKSETIMKRLGAKNLIYESCDHAWQLNALPKVPILIIYRGKDIEFNSSNVKILFDSTADRFLDVESLIFLIEGLVHIISNG